MLAPSSMIRFLALLVAAIATAAVAGCGGEEEADTERGRALFTQNCGECHVLAQAGTSGERGPNLDATFADARASGMNDKTVATVVSDQIANPRAVREGDPVYDQVFMPADIVTGQDAADVAAYVGAVAGVAGIEPPDLGPAELFADRCGSCHALEAAGTAGTIGPDLDEVLAGQDFDMVEESIVDPDAEVSPGFAQGVMPSFEGVLTPEQIQELVDYLLENAGGGNGSANGNGGGNGAADASGGQ